MTKRTTKPRIVEIGERDGWICNGCGEAVVRHDPSILPTPRPNRYATIDHKDPDGGDGDANLWLLCNICNSSKGSRTMDEWTKTLDFDSTFMRKGFTMVPNALLENATLSLGARMTLISLMSFAWKGSPFPGQQRLAGMLGCTDRTVREYLAELRDGGFLKVGRRGRGKTNVYRISQNAIMRLVPEDSSAPQESLDLDDRKQSSGLERKQASGEEYEVKEYEESSTTANAVVSRAPGTSYDPLKGMKVDGKNLPWDALVDVTRADENLESGQIGRALKLIREAVIRQWPASDALTPEMTESFIATEIVVRASQYRARWPNVELTPTALAKNWTRVMTPLPGRDPDSALAAAQAGIEAARRQT